MKKTIFTALLILLSTFLASTASAQSTSLSVSPPVIEILIAPNKKATQTFNFKYLGDNIIIIPELHLVKPDGKSGHSLIDPNPVDPATIPLIVTIIGHTFGEPIELSNNSLPLTLTFEAATTDIAEDVYLALVVRALSDEASLSSSPTSPAISALILTTINPSGVMPINLEIQDFSLPFIHDSWLPLTVSPIVKNNIPIMIRPEGKFEIITPSGEAALSMDLYPNLILGDSSRTILGAGEDNSTTSLTWTPKWTNFGPHRIHLLLTTQGGTKLTDVEKIVWIIPVRILIIIGLFISLFAIYFTTKKSSKILNT